MSLSQLPSDQKLKELKLAIDETSMKALFDSDPSRFETFSAQAPHVFLDFSKNRVNTEILDTLLALCDEAKLRNKIDDMFSGAPVNNTEGRAVLHTALRRQPEQSTLEVSGENISGEITSTLDNVYAFINQVHNGEIRGYTNRKLTTLVSIGIGGSYLGPLMVNEALSPFSLPEFKSYFVANIDSSDLSEVLKKIDAESTLFVIQSKSFKTQETLENALASRDWFLAQGATEKDVSKHFLAVSSNVDEAVSFGIPKERVFPMWDWVGGRYSLWSAIGLPIMFELGTDTFCALLKGANAMDQHFQSAQWNNNIPVLLAILGIWYNNYFGAETHAILPYDQYLQFLPAYLQQLDMESNGKSVDREGQALTDNSGPVIWGGIGCNGQHAYHQLMHQGTRFVPADFIVTMKPHNPIAEHHPHLIANCFAQSQALMAGKDLKQATEELTEAEHPHPESLAPHKVIEGNKPSNTIVLESLNPESLGALIAMYEHKVFVQGVLWNVNSFDQWGVELGKTMEKSIYEAMSSETALAKMDASTKGLIALYNKNRGH